MQGYNIEITRDGIYDSSGNKITVEELMKMHFDNGGNVSKSFEDRTIYKFDENGNIIRERTACEVFYFE